MSSSLFFGRPILTGAVLLSRLSNSYNICDDQVLYNEIITLEQLFQQRPLRQMAHDEIIALKYGMMHWRRAMKNRLLNGVLSPEWAQALGSLALWFDNAACKQIYRRAKGDPIFEKIKKKLAQFFAKQTNKVFYRLCEGEELNLCGPGMGLAMVANRKSKERLESWGKKACFGYYRYQNGGVFYRGIEFLPGDVLLSSVNLGGNGCFTSFTEPRNYCFHSGFFCLLPFGEKKLPVVIESYELGVRAVPLNHFLSKSFNNYVEVLRCREVEPSHYEAIAERAWWQIKTARGYNFDTEDQNRVYMACPTVGTDLFEAIGIKRVEAGSIVTDPKIAENLYRFGLLNHTLLFPIDYLLDSRFACVGILDNGALEMCVAQECSDRIFKDVFRDGVVTFPAMPLFYHLLAFGVDQIKKGSLLGHVIAFLTGFLAENLPRAKTSLIAMIETCALYVAQMERRVATRIEGSFDLTKAFDIEKFCCFWKEDRRIKKIYKPLRKWFSLS